MESRMLKLRWPATCCGCGAQLPAGTHAQWDPSSRTVTCTECVDATDRPHPDPPAVPTSTPVDQGFAGASARREYLLRKRNREARTRHRHPRIGGLLIAVHRERQHESAYLQGALGEQSVGRALERQAVKGPAQVLHDRRMPRARTNIDHLAIAPTGVYVIDAKAIRGSVRVARPLFGAPRLLVDGRNRRNLVDGLERQVLAVRAALSHINRADVPVRGVLCFTKADLPLFGRCEIRGYRLRHPRGTARALNRNGPLTQPEIDSLARELAHAFPRA
jgi:Nuclease-related domain